MAEEGQQYCLRWNNYSENITSEFEALLGQEDFVDVTIACEKQSIKAHKVVLSACSSYFRTLLKENPCQHPIIILKDVAYSELTALLYFMYHGQVMVDQEHIPRLLQIAQLLEVRGLSEVTSNFLEDEVQAKREVKSKAAIDEAPTPIPPLSVVSTPVLVPFTPTRPSKTPTPPPAKRAKTARPVPMLQSILSQRLTTPPSLVEPNADANQAARTLTALAARLQGIPSSSSSTSGLTLETLLASKDNPERPFSNRSTTSSEDLHSQKDGEDKSGMLNDGDTSVDAEFDDSAIQVKEEPAIEFDDDYQDDSTRGGGSADEEDAEMEGESGGEGSGGEGSGYLPLLAQHLSSPLMLSASAKLCAAASRAKMASASQPATPPTDNSDGETPRKLAFHEPRPCPICHRMYRDAATLRTHTAIMHAEGKDPFTCLCGQLFRTKYEMYNHKKNGHR